MNEATVEWYAWRLGGMVPGTTKTHLLRACLEQGDVVRAAWDGFVRSVADPKTYFEDDFGGLKALLPIVERGLSLGDVDAGPGFSTYARVAVVREELRDRIYREVFESTLQLLEPSVAPPLVLRGLAIAETCYEQPQRRHNHGIDLLLDEGALWSASRVLTEAGYTVVQGGAAAVHRRHRHRSGLPVTLHSRLFEMPHLGEPADLRSRAVAFVAGGKHLNTLDPADHLVHVCGHAAYSRSRANLRWVCDAVLLIRHVPGLDWERLEHTAVMSGLGLPVAVALTYLSRCFDVPIPPDRVARLYRQCAIDLPHVRAAVHAIALECPAPGAENRPAVWTPTVARLRMLAFRSVPSAAYMRWKYGAEGLVSLARSYLGRGIGFLSRRLRHLPGTLLR
ncbi:MAG: nucleotidyltransferase family protein [Pseudomonadales bacterium]